MWTNTDYDNLPTFADYLKQVPLATLFADIDIDADTQDRIAYYFQLRKIGDVADRFTIFFRREADAMARQYNQYLRVETIDMDPMVSDYMERRRKTKTSESGKDNTTMETNSNGSTSGAPTRTVKEVVDDTNTDTRNGNSNNTGKTDDKTLAAAVPNSAVGADGAFPESLDWKYMSSQQENRGTSESNETHKDTTETIGKRDRTYTESYDGAQTNEDNTHGTTDRTTSRDNAGDEWERYSGRHEAPQDMADRARSYIVRTNAFRWLIAGLEPCFMGIYDD